MRREEELGENEEVRMRREEELGENEEGRGAR